MDRIVGEEILPQQLSIQAELLQEGAVRRVVHIDDRIPTHVHPALVDGDALHVIVVIRADLADPERIASARGEFDGEGLRIGALGLPGQGAEGIPGDVSARFVGSHAVEFIIRLGSEKVKLHRK